MKMKRTVYIALSLLVACACSSGSGDMAAVYTISVDKNVIEADGRDMAVFTITDADGNVMTTEANMGKIYFKNVATGFNLKKYSTGFTSVSNGEYEFVGMCMGVKTSNTVKITVQNRRTYELYHRNVGLFKCTSVWCSACPGLSATLHALDEDTAAHSVVLSCHGKFNGKEDPFALNIFSPDLGNMMLSAFGGSGWPTLIYDLDRAETGAGVSRSELADNVMSRRLDYPATCGIKVNSSAIDGDALKVSASMKTSAGGYYDLTCAVVEDGCQYYASGSFSVDEKGVFDDVLVAAQANFMTYSAESGKEFQEGEELTREFTFDLGGIELPSDRLERMSVVAFAHRRLNGNGSIMDNIVSVPFGQRSEYILND